MTVKILSSTSTFNGVSYNTNKTQSAKGELMTFKNFGYLQTAQKVTPDEIEYHVRDVRRDDCHCEIPYGR
ncbi:hypothetical protein [Lunatibacter salilacus]|uniref:hypothetical protein n=1 Tax=Lunatibacter salilacus TaxID=2483804 RepID=UPI001F2543FE|nr:hypothetical protein [Lunatibacter salilacus]